MNYYEAAKIRKKGFADLMTDKLTSGQGVFSSARSALSDKMKARSTGIKETFDPLNIAKTLTGGSNLAPAMLGRLLGRKSSDINYFAGKKQYTPRSESSYFNNYTPPTVSSGGSRKATRVLEKMLSFMEKSRTDDMQEQDTLDSFNELNENMREDRHKEVMDVFIEATKARRKAEKDMAREAKKRERAAKKEKEPEVKKEPPPKTEVTKPKPEVPKTEAPTTVKPVETAPKPPTATPTTPPATPKPPIVKPAVTEAAKTAAKVGLGAGAAVVASQAIAGAESGNDYTVSYGDSPKSKKRKAVEMTGKNITEMTLSELEEYQKKRGPKENAVGKYQMIQSTLFGTPGVPGTGLVNQLKLDKDKTLFDEKTQDLLYQKLYSGYEPGLRAMGAPITPGYLYMMHYLGPRATQVVFEASKESPNLTIAEALLKAKEKYPKNNFDNIIEANKKDMTTIKVSEFSATLQNRLEKKGGLVPHSSSGVGQNIDEASKNNTDMKKDMSQGSAGGSTVIVQNNNTTQAKTNIHRAAPQEQLNPTMR
jgi:hypothetical protein